MSVMNLNCFQDKTAKYDHINKVVKQDLQGPIKNILVYIENQTISHNFISNTHFTFDAGTGIVLSDHFVKLISW